MRADDLFSARPGRPRARLRHGLGVLVTLLALHGCGTASTVDGVSTMDPDTDTDTDAPDGGGMDADAPRDVAPDGDPADGDRPDGELADAIARDIAPGDTRDDADLADVPDASDGSAPLDAHPHDVGEDGGGPDGGGPGDAGAPDADPDPDTGAADVADTDAGTWDPPPRPPTEPPPRTASWRYGGGVGYPDRVDPDWPVVTVVSDVAGLVSALGAAVSGDVVYVADDARIDLTGVDVPCLGDGVWLASGRGAEGSAGGMIFSDEIERPLLRVCGDDVRITGLRIVGFDADTCPPAWPDACTGEDRTGGVNCRDCTPSTFAIQARGFDRLEVDNNEIAGWSYAGVWLTDSVDNRVHHNHIHHTQREGLGYGVVLTRGGDGLVTVDIAWNRFDDNRHAVAGSGEPGQDYVARDNLVMHDSIGHIFDMHGEAEGLPDSDSELAGGHIEIHGNTVLCDDQYTLVVRGRPEHGVWLYDNCLARADAGAAARQRFFTGRFHVDRSPDGPAPNRYGQSPGDCEPVRWCASSGGTAPWQLLATSSYDLSRLGFADFDGDGRQDVFDARDGAWWFVSAGAGSWTRLNTSSAPLDQLRFADVDGDGRDDVLRATGSAWTVSDGGRGRWRDLRTTAEPLEGVAFADFDGDGRDDAFRATGTRWQWAPGATGAWRDLRADTSRLDALRFGDFDGDGRADVFRATGSDWQWSRSGTAEWARLNRSGYGLDALRFGDFDGDGRTDVMRMSGVRWFVSWGGASGWAELRVEDAVDAVVGDFDGDGRDDLFRTGCL